MYPKKGMYIRPLLGIYKQDIIDYLTQHGLSYMTDQSNNDDAYLRNRIRASVIPALQACDERFDSSFKKTVNHLQATELFLEKLTHEMVAVMTITSAGTGAGTSAGMNVSARNIDYVAFMHADPVMQHRILNLLFVESRMPYTPTQSFFQEIMRFLANAGSGEHTVHIRWCIVKDRKNGLLHVMERPL
jgi:hypothetical protein